MAWTAPTDKATGDIVTAAIYNSMLGATGNIAETAPAKFTTAGDTIYADGANSAARLAIGAANEILAVNSGATAPEWVANAPAASAITGLTADSSLFVDSAAALGSVALGATGTVYTSAGATANPTWSAIPPAGGAWTCIAASNTSTSFTNTSGASILNFPSISILPGEWFVVTGRAHTTTTNGYQCNIWVNPTSASETARFLTNGSVGSGIQINTWYSSAGGFWFIGCVGTTADQEPSSAPGTGGAGWTCIGFTNATSQTDYRSWNTGNSGMLYNGPTGYPKKNFHYNEEITAIDIYANINGGYTSALESCYVYKLATSI
jgi:hypothetical protein